MTIDEIKRLAELVQAQVVKVTDWGEKYFDADDWEKVQLSEYLLKLCELVEKAEAQLGAGWKECQEVSKVDKEAGVITMKSGITWQHNEWWEAAKKEAGL